MERARRPFLRRRESEIAANRANRETCFQAVERIGPKVTAESLKRFPEVARAKPPKQPGSVTGIAFERSLNAPRW
ncbi:hypothetical protein [Ancylobacter terrae]|uniref:hypothetical protein n=1 Tax=Ancylobacter sp. sgz301288 TaxID=3342077 RepID=UPI00385CA583